MVASSPLIRTDKAKSRTCNILCPDVEGKKVHDQCGEPARANLQSKCTEKDESLPLTAWQHHPRFFVFLLLVGDAQESVWRMRRQLVKIPKSTEG